MSFSQFRPTFAVGCYLFLALFAAYVVNAQSNDITRPNVVYILADDMGFGDVGVITQDYRFEPGSAIITPNLNALYSLNTSATLVRSYAGGPSCSPTRASVLTGKNNHRVCVWGPNRGGGDDFVNASPNVMPPSQYTIGKAAKEHGYETSFIGKWHLGDVKDIPAKNPLYPPATPDTAGFDHWVATVRSGNTMTPNCACFDESECVYGPNANYDCINYWFLNSTGLLDRVNATIQKDDNEYIVDEFEKFLNKRDTSKPFFAHLSTHTSHTKYAAADPFLNLYDESLDNVNRHYMGSISTMDAEIGRIRTILREKGLWNNTILWFTSDNGAKPKSGAQGYGSNGPLRGFKGDLYEGGIRVPGVLEWPAVIKSHMNITVPVITSDVLPTMLDIWGSLTTDRDEQNRTVLNDLTNVIDGESIFPWLSNSTEQDHREHGLFFRTTRASGYSRSYTGYDHWGAVMSRDGRFKVIGTYGLAEPYQLTDGSTEMYELGGTLNPDTQEEYTDVSSTYPDIKADLIAQYNEWLFSIDTSMEQAGCGAACLFVASRDNAPNACDGYAGDTTLIERPCPDVACTNQQPCAYNPDTETHYCDCSDDFTGTSCEHDAADQCASSPCLNGGSCTDGSFDFSCTCVDGYTDTQCETNIDECESHECAHGATCVDGINTYTCDCAGGWTGDYCHTDLDDCESSPCENGGVCADVGAMLFTCDCTGTLHSGEFCEHNYVDCEITPPCENGGTCTEPSPYEYECACDGFTGPTCSIDIDDCASSPCTHGVCEDTGINSFSCDCTDSGYEGVLCDVDLDDCLSSPCTNNGICSDAGANAFECDCAGTGFEGSTCATDVDDCLSSPCTNGACIDAGANVFICDCSASGFEGDLCQTDVDDCVSTPCENGGACSDAGTNAFTCDCTDTGATGMTCEDDIDDCASNPCQNAGLCIDAGPFAFSCDCNGTFHTGTVCEIPYVDCTTTLPCKNNGVCTDTEPGAYECDCSGTGFEGSTCETDVDECLSSPCQFDGICQDMGVLSFSCNCTGTGYEGNLCQTDIDECVSCPCMNGGTCTDAGVNNYTCACDGTTGANCEIDIDDCTSSPCANNGACSDTGLHAYTCDCDGTDATGTRCETILNECDSDPCDHGTCQDGLSAFSCICDVGYNGDLCEVDVDDCGSNPCFNEGICIDQVGDGGFKCNCTSVQLCEACNVVNYGGFDCSLVISNPTITAANTLTISNFAVCAVFVVHSSIKFMF